ncbi:MAG: toprim domain-containing protein [Pseudomonadota bacterium]
MTDAQTLTHALGGTWRGHSGNAPCPVCQPERRRNQQGLSLRMDGGRLLAFCHKTGCTFRDIATAAGLPPGAVVTDATAQREADAKQALDVARREAQATALWGDTETVPIQGTQAQAYLRGRGITCPLPDTLRFHPQGWHATGHRYPMMLAQVEGAAGFAIHRTYLRADGRGKAAVTPDKAMLGPCAGGAVRLSQAEGPLVVCEGIETGLSLLCGLLHAPARVWAALSTSGIRGLRLPPVAGRLTIAADGDQPGRDAAYALAARAEALGWRVSLLPAPDGRDWNDVLFLKTGKEGTQ